MQAKPYLLVQVGPLGQSGGISDNMQGIGDWARSLERPTLTINTSCNGSRLRRAAVGLAGVAHATLTAVTRRDALFHVHMASNGSFVRKSVVTIVAHVAGRPVVLQVRGGGFPAFASKESHFRRRWIRTVLQCADIVLVLNEATRNILVQLQPDACVRILPNPATMVCGGRTDPEQRRVLFAGRLCHDKGVDTLLEAVRLLQLHGVQADYVLAGDGETEEAKIVALQLPQSDQVKVTGWLSKEQLHDELHKASVFCLPSHVEGMPMALLQAMGHGLACIVTPVGAMADLIRDQVNGMVVPVGDTQRLAQAMDTLLASAALRARLGEQAFATVQAHHSPAVVMASLDEVYSLVLSRRSADGVS